MKSWSSMTILMIISIFSVFIMISLLNLLSTFSFSFMLEIDFMLMNFLPVQFMLLVDKWSLLFSFTVILISLSVFIFSTYYMLTEIHYMRFHLLLLLFVMSMILLIFSPGVFSMFLGWDGLGLTSFILVIYYNNSKSLNAGIMTFLTNRLGDGFLLCAMSMAMITFNFNSCYMGYSSEVEWGSSVIMLLFVLGAFTKSAQIPFSAWLPAAMAAPTPVSSLVHSSTLVTAGVYLFFRFFDVMGKDALSCLTLIGLLTMIMASVSAITESDLKKIVALSTLSQLGLMVSALGLSQPSLCFFHMLTHAFFKALMFIGVGSTIHLESSYQDLKIMGSMFNHPFTLGILLGSNFSLCGVPFFSGFFSKEMIIQSYSGLLYSESSSLLIYMIFLLSILLTQIYSIRFFIKTVVKSNYYFSIKSSMYENYSLISSMLILLLPAVLTGSIFSMMWNLEFDFFLDSFLIKMVILSMFFISLIISQYFFSNLLLSHPKFWLFSNMWFLPWSSTDYFWHFIRNQSYEKLVFVCNSFDMLMFYSLNFLSYSLYNVKDMKNFSVLKLCFISLIFMLFMIV